MKRALAVVTIAVIVAGVAAVAAVAAWAYQGQVWLRDDYTAGYESGLALPQDVKGHPCLAIAETHSNSAHAQVAFAGGCADAMRGKTARPEAVGGFVSDAYGLWGPFG